MNSILVVFFSFILALAIWWEHDSLRNCVLVIGVYCLAVYWVLDRNKDSDVFGFKPKALVSNILISIAYVSVNFLVAYKAYMFGGYNIIAFLCWLIVTSLLLLSKWKK